MIKLQKQIEIVRSNVDGLSSLSQTSADAIKALLDKHYIEVGISVINNIEDLDKLVDSKPDLVFLGMKFLPVDITLGKHDANKIWISDYLDEANIAYTGSTSRSAAFDLDKIVAKRQIQAFGIQTPPFFIASPITHANSSDITLEYPLFIKPNKMGGGQGIDDFSVVHNFYQFKTKVQSIHDLYQSLSLVESYLSGREFSVGILNDGFSGNYLAMPIELLADINLNGDRMLSQDVKNANSEVVTTVEDVLLKAEICLLALRAFKAFGARDYGRIDIRLNTDGIPQFLEANLIPSLIEGYGSFPKACLMNIGMDYETMILRIVDLGLSRSVEIESEKSTIAETDLLVTA
jgi:D-alanine-D-alanine ligase